MAAVSVPTGIKGWAMLILVVAVAIAVIWRIPQIRGIVTGS